MSDKPCPVPLDNVMVLIFGGMMLFHDAFCYEILGHRKEHDGSDAEGGGADRRG